MPDDHQATSSDRPVHHVFYGPDPTRPVAFTVPPVEATPETPLPDARPLLRVCAGRDEANTVLFRVAVQLVGSWQYVHEQRPKDPTDLAQLNEQLNLATWLLDREAGGHTKGVVYQADAPLSPSTYGQWVSWLVWKYVLYALRQNDAECHERDAAELGWCIESFNELVANVRAGRLRLPPEQGPEGDGTEFPPRRVWPESPNRNARADGSVPAGG